MPIIRSGQFDAFRETADSGLSERLCAYLTESYPDDAGLMTPEELRVFVDAVCARARQEFELTTQMDIARFAELAFAFGAGFDQDAELPWAGPVLRDSSMPMSDRMALVWFEADRILNETETTPGEHDSEP